MKIRILTSIILSLTFLKVSGQFFDESQSPLRVKWHYINHQGFKIIFPSPIEKDAQRMANTFSYIYPRLASDLQLHKTDYPVILQNQGTSANGFVQLAPKKSQFYTISPQNFDSQDWLNNLAVHELRHVAQYQKILGPSNFPLSDRLRFAYLGISTPLWFLEGDAVLTETKKTNAGRGRQPSWIMPFRTQLLSGKTPSYSKAYFGSERSVEVGYYQLGYLLNAQLHNTLGEAASNKLMTELAKPKIVPYPFSQSLKKLSGKSTRQFYLQTVKQLQVAWQAQADSTPHISYTAINRPHQYESNYLFPVQTEQGDLLALKQSKKRSPCLVRISPKGKEEVLINIGYQEEPWFSYANGKIVWDEFRADARYKQRSYNVVCSYNLLTGEKTQLSHKNRLFAPRLSADGSKIIAVNINWDNKAELQILDSQTGHTISSIKNPENFHLQAPAFDEQGDKITWISVCEEGKSLWLAQGAHKRQLISNTRQQIDKPIFRGDKIIFNAHYNGLDNIYQIDTATLEVKALSAAKFGAFNASISTDGQQMFFNNYDISGYNIASDYINEKAIGQNHFVNFVASQKSNENIFEQIPDSTFQSKPYRAFSHTINFHSIVPLTDEPGEKWGLQLQSDDLLNTTSIRLASSYLSSLGRWTHEAQLSYKALYPIIDLAYLNRPRAGYYRFGKQLHHAQWREDVFSLKLSVPLSINHFDRQWTWKADLSTYLVNRHFEASEKGKLIETVRFPMSYRLAFGQSSRKAERDIAPPWAQQFEFNYQSFPFDSNRSGELFSIQSYFYFPGLLANHSFLASFQYQHLSKNFAGSLAIDPVYGYYQIKALSPLINNLRLHYRFPLLFNDWELGSIAYIRNLKAGLFCHYENIGHDKMAKAPKSFGLELSSDMNLLRYTPIATLGTRLIFVNKIYQQKPIFELLFNYFF